MYSDQIRLSSPSKRAPTPPTPPQTSPMRVTATPKRPSQEYPDSPRRRRPPPMFAKNSAVLHPEYSSGDTIFEPGSQVSARATSRNLRRSFHLTQLKRSSLHLEKRLVSQKIQEHEISLQALKERMLDIEENIVNTTEAVGSLHCYMDQVGVPIPDMPDHIASSIFFPEDDITSEGTQNETLFAVTPGEAENELVSD